MKRILKWKVLLSLCCIWLAAADAKAQLVNESFENWCGTVLTNGSGLCPTFANACVPGWRRAHGSPQIIPSSGAPDGNNFIQMWGSSGWGEGIVADHNFLPGKKYKICMWVRNDVNNGRLVIRAANGIPVLPDGTVNCSDNFPGVPFQNIYDVPLVWNTGWTRITFDYVATGNYTQFWVFPICSTGGGVVWLNVDDIDIAESCTPDAVYNMFQNTAGGIVQSGYYDDIEYIYAGSSAGGAPVGSGTVTSDANAYVTFEAGTLVLISENFMATPNGGQLFHALIAPCDDASCGDETFMEGTDGTQGDPNEPYEGGGGTTPGDSRSNADNGLYAGAEVYPNPTTGILRVITRYDAEAAYEITAITGQVLMKGKIRNNETLDIGEYPPGIYLLKITEGITHHQSTHRIVKQQ